MLKKIVMVFLVSCTALVLNLNIAGAEEFAERKGFLIGLGPTIGGETNIIKQVAGGARFRLGGGFNEKFLLYWDSSYFYTRKNSRDYNIVQEQARAQYFVYDNFYVNLGGGFVTGSISCSSTSGGVTTTTEQSKLGFVIGGGAGYEFRLTKHFVMAPEVTFDYDRIKGVNYYIPAAYLHLGWYL